MMKAFRFALVLLLMMTLASCAPTLLHGRFAQTVSENEMTRLAIIEDAAGGPDTSVVFIQIPLPNGWQEALWGYKRGPLVMPPELQPPNLAEIETQCHLTPSSVLRLHGGIGGGWERYEQILRQTALVHNSPVVVLTGMTLEMQSASTSTNWLVAAVTFSGELAQAGCLYEQLGSPTVAHSIGNLGCTEPNTPGPSPGFCSSPAPVNP